MATVLKKWPILNNRILKNILLLIEGKVKAREIPRKITNYCLDNSRLARRIKRNKFTINDVIFRPIVQSDKTSYVEFILNYFGPDVFRKKNGISVPICDSTYFCYIALYKDKIIGDGGIRKIRPNDVNLWRISGLSLLPVFRGYGIGERLLQTLISVVKEGFISIEVSKDNYRAIALYKKSGFRLMSNLERIGIDNTKRPSEQIVMVLNKTGPEMTETT